MKQPERVAAVDKIEDQRKPEDFIGHRNRTPVLLSAKEGNYSFLVIDYKNERFFSFGV